MKLNKLTGSVYFASSVMFIAAIVSLVIAFITNRGDMTTAVLIIVGFMLIVTGLFILLTAERAPLPAFLTELMPVQATENIAVMLGDLGVTSNTVHRYLKKSEEVIQINPITGGRIPEVSADNTFVIEKNWSGAVYPAVSSTLLRKLKNEDNLKVPLNNTDMLSTCLNEVVCDYLAIAKKVTLSKNNQSISLLLSGFSMSRMCQTMQKASPKCCTMVGCPLCSLLAAIIAESEDCDVMSDNAAVEKDRLILAFSLHKRD
ncbi:MAG: hypothetical protein Q4Q53_07960 [Methanocorpusculum sp.]|nr:hypothetical protein [Methanocorpusculum sp.]